MMKPTLILIAFIATFSIAWAQQTDTAKKTSADTVIVDNPAKPPEFPGGTKKLYRALTKIVRYPAVAKEHNTQGTIILTFVVEKDGSVSNVKVKNGVSPELDNETIRIIKLLPKFLPGQNKNGEPVRCNYGDFPFSYALQTDQ